MGHPAELIMPYAKLTLSYADKVAEGITPAQFGRKPDGVDTNTPAWVFGHLALYPENMMMLLGMRGAEEDEAWQKMFGNGSVCQDDPSGTVYPSMDVLLDRYRSRHHVLLEALPGIDEAVFDAETPHEGIRDMFPKTGQFVAFMLGAHAMMHLGQISAWRRCMGLGPCM